MNGTEPILPEPPSVTGISDIQRAIGWAKKLSRDNEGLTFCVVARTYASDYAVFEDGERKRLTQSRPDVFTTMARYQKNKCHFMSPLCRVQMRVGRKG